MRGPLALLLVAPALAVVALFFLIPLALSLAGAFEGEDGPSLAPLVSAIALYRRDVLFSLAFVALATAAIAAGAIAIGAYLTLGRNTLAVRLLAALYRWPLFIPFIVAAQAMRGFLGQNGLMNTTLISVAGMPEGWAQSFLDWRGT